jgi:hypothetical protein
LGDRIGNRRDLVAILDRLPIASGITAIWIALKLSIVKFVNWEISSGIVVISLFALESSRSYGESGETRFYPKILSVSYKDLSRTL